MLSCTVNLIESLFSPNKILSTVSTVETLKILIYWFLVCFKRLFFNMFLEHLDFILLIKVLSSGSCLGE
jgi:hypothetical protein